MSETPISPKDTPEEAVYDGVIEALELAVAKIPLPYLDSQSITKEPDEIEKVYRAIYRLRRRVKRMKRKSARGRVSPRIRRKVMTR